MTSISTVLHLCYLFLWVLNLVFRTQLKKKELNRDEGITGLLEVIILEAYLMEVDTSRKPFGFEIYVLGSTIIPTAVKKWL